MLPAGDFSDWVHEITGALSGERGADVPCGDCTACCTSFQVIHIGPDEADTLAAIPADLLDLAPGMAEGNVLMRHDERGHCPMLVDNACSIYASRPQMCRTYDCRIFPAAGIEQRDEGKEQIGIRALRWEFSHPTATDTAQHEAVRAAARYLVEHPEASPDFAPPPNATRHAILAIQAHELFLPPNEPQPLDVHMQLRWS